MAALNSTIIPINLLAKYSPPTLSLQYTIEGQKMQYVHEMPFTIEASMTPEMAYSQLLSIHKSYLDPSVLTKKQVIYQIGNSIAF